MRRRASGRRASPSPASVDRKECPGTSAPASGRVQALLAVARLTLLAGFVGVSAHCSGARTKMSQLADATSFRGLVDVGGCRLFLNCSGAAREATPVVVLDAGHGNTSAAWNLVQPEVGHFARVCSYDRAGTGKSDAAPKPRTSQNIVRDLHTLLANAGITAPYVLVGHSFGGLNARLFASQYPKEVTGMVLVDSSHEDEDDRTLALVPPELLRQARPEDMVMTSREGVDLRKSFAQARAADWHSDIPLIVLTRGRPYRPEDYRVPALAPQLEQLHMELQKDLARRSSKGRQIIAARSGQDIPHDQPALVAEAIRRVVEEASSR